MLLSGAIKGYLIDRAAGGLSDSTATLYRKLLTHFLEWLGDKEITEITAADLNAWMAYLRTDYKPRRPGPGGSEHLSGSALDNHWKVQKSFWKWANETLDIPRPDLKLARPRFVDEEIIPYTEQEMQRILFAVEWTREAESVARKSYRQRRATRLRDRAIVLLLLDTGIRIGELVRLRIADIDMDASELHVKPYGSGVKSRPRTVPFQRTARAALWQYLEKERQGAQAEDSLFEITDKALQHLFQGIERRTQIHNVNAHRFRHTFAVEYLRNGGDVFTLQKLLGHSTLEMVRRYVAIADGDVKTVHRRASPADRWKLR